MKFCVIGLGRFGYQVATVLAENGMEVMAVDSNESIVAKIRDKVTQAVCMRVADEDSLRSIGVEEMDNIVIAMAESFAQSILVTAILKKIGVKKIIARAVNDIHKDILKLIGADQVVLPEKEIGIRLADSLSSSFTDLTRLSKDFSISLIIAPKRFVGQKVQDLKLFERNHIYCIGIKQNDDQIIPIDPNHVIKEKDRLIFAGDNADLENIAKM